MTSYITDDMTPKEKVKRFLAHALQVEKENSKAFSDAAKAASDAAKAASDAAKAASDAAKAVSDAAKAVIATTQLLYEREKKNGKSIEFLAEKFIELQLSVPDVPTAALVPAPRSTGFVFGGHESTSGGGFRFGTPGRAGGGGLRVEKSASGGGPTNAEGAAKEDSELTANSPRSCRRKRISSCIWSCHVASTVFSRLVVHDRSKKQEMMSSDLIE